MWDKKIKAIARDRHLQEKKRKCKRIFRSSLLLDKGNAQEKKQEIRNLVKENVGRLSLTRKGGGEKQTPILRSSE